MTIEKLIENARKAMQEIEDYTQEQVDAMVEAMADAITEEGDQLAVEAIEETGMGRLDHKKFKNNDFPKNIRQSLKGKKSMGVIGVEEEIGITKIAKPVGVIGSVTPTTNPTITPYGNGSMAIKGKNAMIVSPHPRAKKVTVRSVNVMREALAKVGAPRDLLQVIEEPTIEKSQELMGSVDLIIATGGPGMVKSAYSSGKPAYGVGPGNVQLILDEGYDLKRGAEMAVEGTAFDNSIVCACTQTMMYPENVEKELFAELEKAGTYMITDEAMIEKFRELSFPNDVVNPEFLGQDPQVIGKILGLDVPDNIQMFGLKIKEAGELLTREKMFPVLTLLSYKTFDEAIKLAITNLEVSGGKGHTAGIFTNSNERATEAGLRLPVGRVLVNHATAYAGGGLANNGLTPSVSLGCGSWGNNIISENLKFEHLLNVSRVADYLGDK